MLPRILEPEVMDTPEEASDYDSMDHSEVNRRFVGDFLAVWNGSVPILDLGTGTAQIPIELCRQRPAPHVRVIAVDLADNMLALARRNVERAGLVDRITLTKADAKGLPHADGTFGAVISNSIIHHVPEPFGCFREMHRMCGAKGTLFVRDLLRPGDLDELRRVVNLHAAGANDHQRKMFGDSLHAALTLEEVRQLVGQLGYPLETVQQTTDRHWTFVASRI